MEEPRTVHIVPDESLLLELKTKFPCTVDGCDRLLPNYGALRMHVVKTHKFYQNEDDRALAMKLKKVNSPTYVYHCPVLGCPKSQKQGDTTCTAFTSMKLLKQHYGKLHAEKKHKCLKCDRGFGLERDKRRHEETCGLLLKCESCGCPYSTVEAMITHCRRKGHIPPMECNAKKKTKHKPLKSRTRDILTPPPTVPPNIFVINVLPSPSKSLSLSPDMPDGFRHILPKPIIQETIPITAVAMATDQILVDKRDLHLMQNVNMQTKNRCVEQGTSTTDDISQLSAFSTTIQTNSVEDTAHKAIDHPGNSLGNVSYFQHSFPEQRSTLNSNNILINASTQHTCRYKPYNGLSSCMTQCSRMSQAVDKGSPEVFSLDAGMCLTKGMQTLRSHPLRSELSIAVAETQTSGDYILKEAMTSADIALNKESKGSQVSPRSKVNGQTSPVYVNSQSCQTSRFSEQKVQRQKRFWKSANKDCALTTVINKPKQQLSNRCTARTKRSGQVGSLCNNCQCVGQCTCVKRPEPLSTAVHRSLCGNKGQITFVNREQHILNPCSKHQVDISHQTDMLIDGLPDDGFQAGNIASFDDFTDNQTQTMGLLEEFNSLAATTATQTAQSYLTHPSTATIETGARNTDTQHSHTQTFVSAFSSPSERASAAPLVHQVLDNTTKLSVSNAGTGPVSALGNPQVLNTTAKSTFLQYNNLGYGPSGDEIISHCDSATDDQPNLPSAPAAHKPPGKVILSGQLTHAINKAGTAQLCQNTDTSGDSHPSAITFADSNIQTTSTALLNLLDMGIQADSGPGTTIQTQTDLDEMWELFCHNMETQTADDILQELGFSDIQIQTNMDLEYFEDNSSTVETQTMWHAMSTAYGSNVEQSDMQTQTLFPTATVPGSTALTFDTDLTDSHTQTPWEDITALILHDL